MSLKRIYPDYQVQPPFKPRGGCLPYVVACLLNKEIIVDQYPNKDDEGNPVSHDFYHASMIMGANLDLLAYFEVLLAVSRRYINGTVKRPRKFLQFSEFSDCAPIVFVSKAHKNEPKSKLILLFETQYRKQAHSIGVVLDVKTMKAIVIDVQKDKILTMNIDKVFMMYNVMRVAILKHSPVQVPTFDDAFFDHLEGDGGVSDN